MTIKEVNGKKFDFQEMTLESALEVQEKIPCLIAATNGSPLPQGTLIFIAERAFKYCLVDGREMGSIGDFFIGDNRALFLPALIAAAEVNFPDFFTKAKDWIASSSSTMTGMMGGSVTSSQATETQ